MKKLSIMLLTSVGLWAQSAPIPVSNQADCQIPFVLTAAAASSSFDNRQNACTFWDITYNSAGFSALSLRVESAPPGATTGVPGTFVAYAGTVVSGINPNTATTQAKTTLNGYFPWMRINLTSATGTGTVVGIALGYVSPPSNISGVSITGTIPVAGTAANGAPIVGNPVLMGFWDGVNIQIPTMCTKQLLFNLAASGNKQIIPAVGSTVTKICHIDFSTTATEDVKLTTGTGADCVTGTADLTGLWKSVQSLDLNYTPFSPLVGVASGAVCLNASTANALGGTVIYAQN